MIGRAAVLTLLLAGCNAVPLYTRSAMPVPPVFPSGDAYAVSTDAALPSFGYAQVFRDPRLIGLIDTALANNRDLRVAAANIAAQRARTRIQRAALLPQVDVGGDATVARGGDRFATDISITGFELDLFGRIAALSEAEQQRYFATVAGARATRVALIGDIADTWLRYAADTSLMEIARDTAASATRSVTLTRARLTGGVAPRTDLRQAEQILATAEADLATLRTSQAQDVNALQLLIGAPVDPALLPGDIDSLGNAVAMLPTGIDSTILLRRPDVLNAEFALRAANAEVGAARAALFPRISLTGVLGFASTALSSLFAGGNFVASGTGGISYPIFRAGAGRANVALAKAQQDAALATYEQAIQSAFRDTADALAQAGTIAQQLAARQRNAEAAADTFRLTDARYRGGIDNFLNSLDAQRSLYTAQRQLISTRLTAASTRVLIYRAIAAEE